MRFGLIHRLMTDALATLGLLALLTSGELTRAMTWGISVALVAVLAMPSRYQDHPRIRTVGMVASVLLLTTQVARLLMGGDVLGLAVEFAACLQVIRLATRRGAAHDQQIVLLALLHLVAGTVLGGGLAYGLCFLGFLVVAPGALVLSHLRREVEGNYRQGARDRTGLPVDVPRILRSRRVISKKFLLFTCSLSIPVFVFTAVLFLLFPRVGLSLLLINHSRSARMIGFSDKVDLGGVGRLRTDPTIAMRVDVPNPPPGNPQRLSLYLRGTAFDHYDGKAWSRTESGRSPARQFGGKYRISPRKDWGGTHLFTIELEPINPPVIFLPSNATGMKLLSKGEPLFGRGPAIWAGPEGEFKYTTADDRGLRYEVYARGVSNHTVARLSGDERARYLQLPPGLPDRIRDLARTWAEGQSSPSALAHTFEKQLRDGYTYDLNSPSGSADNPLDHFLFESRSGHCEYYSTAMAVMLRALGVPTRNVTGFIGGTYNRFANFYAVRQGDAHSWVEVYTGNGWTRFDPTPPASAAPRAETAGLMAFLRDVLEAGAQRWSRHVVGYDLNQQIRLLRNSPFRMKKGESQHEFRRRIGLVVAGIIGAAAALYLLRRLRRRSGKGRANDETIQPAVVQAVALYQQLESAMMVKGIGRTPSTPPWAHARALQALGHPLAAEVVALTRIYQEARFGDLEIREEVEKDYLARVKALRAFEHEPPSQAA